MGRAFGSALSLPPPNTRPGRVGSVSGFPPLMFAVLGIGEGECAGEATRGFATWGLRLVGCGRWGATCAGAGEPAMDPKVRFDGARLLATGPPLGM